MNFCHFSFKYKKAARTAKVYDDRPFSSLVTSHRPPASTHLLVQSEDDEEIPFNPSTDYDFKSFNHYFDEPIYTEPDCKEVTVTPDDLDVIKPSPHSPHSPLYDMLRMTGGRSHCLLLSSDSDYESYSVDRMDLENSQGKIH